MQSGLYIIGTPIGNLSDISNRAIDTLKKVDLILAEDTRVFSKLSSTFNIDTKKISFHEHNEKNLIPSIMEKLESGLSIAIVTDCGMPSISDPGFRLVRECRDKKLDIFIVPGPTAVISALVLSGFPTDRFTFCGFFDEKKIKDDSKIKHTIVYYESPKRINKTIKILSKFMPERRIAIVREITKIYEETIIGYPADLVDLNLKGEIVIVIEPVKDSKISDKELSDIVNEISKNIPVKDLAFKYSKELGVSKKEIYNKLVNN